MLRIVSFCYLLLSLFVYSAHAQTTSSTDQSRHAWFGGTTPPQIQTQAEVPLQPLAQQVRRLEAALQLLGQPFDRTTEAAIDHAIAQTDERTGVSLLEKALDPNVLATVDINAESRVKVERGPAPAELVKGGSSLFLVKVNNRAGITSQLSVASPNNGPVYVTSDGDPAPAMVLTQADVRDRWADISLANSAPLDKKLSGFPLEYQVLEVYSRDAGQRSARISFNAGQGTQDLGFRNELAVLFLAKPSHQIKLHLRDETGKPTTAALEIRDDRNRLYPNPSKRLAPDLYFRPQVYRADGESIDLPPGHYSVTATSGPEYLPITKDVEASTVSPNDFTLQLSRWIDPSKYGWFSGDTARTRGRLFPLQEPGRRCTAQRHDAPD